MKTNLKRVGVALLFIPMMFFSCNKLENESPSTGKGKVVVHITDAPFPASLVEHVFVTIDKLELQLKDGNCKTSDGEYIPDCTDGFILIVEEPVTIDLMKLRNGLNQMLAEVEVPVGAYKLIRLYVLESEIVLDNETSFAIKIPGGSADGLKIHLKDPIVVTEEGMAEILIDFDLSRSFIVQGNPKSKKGIVGFIFKPVIRAVDLNKSGRLSGKVSDSLGKPIDEALITLIQGDELITTALTNPGGVFKIIGVPVGIYKIIVEKEGYKTVELTSIETKKKSEVAKNIVLQKE